MDPVVPEGLSVLEIMLRVTPGRLAPLDPDGGERGPGKWSRREELGHLIDSAANNHQRVVRMQLGATAIADYDAEPWVEVQRYDSRSWEELVELWSVLNRHLSITAARVPDSGWSSRASIGASPPETLAFIIDDYVRHLRGHLEHIGVLFDDLPRIRDFKGRPGGAT
jgi:hypothetical protein